MFSTPQVIFFIRKPARFPQLKNARIVSTAQLSTTVCDSRTTIRGFSLYPRVLLGAKAKTRYKEKVMTTLGTHLFTLLFGKYVGSDEFGNKYYRRKAKGTRRERRWVVYKKDEDASSIPPQWHGWIHFSLASPPEGQKIKIWPWQKPHTPNFTGTAKAYRPKGHFFKGGKRAQSYGDYQAWTPKGE